MMYQFKSDARDQIERAGIVQAELAAAANMDRFHLNKRLRGQGHVRPATANRIARAYAEQARITQDAALSLLFEEINVERSADRAK
jgi:hypothetical protein